MRRISHYSKNPRRGTKRAFMGKYVRSIWRGEKKHGYSGKKALRRGRYFKAARDYSR